MGHAQVTLSRLTDTLYISQDDYFARENSLVYIGPEHITIIGATWTPATAKELHQAIQAISNKPVTEVIDTNYHPDRAGGNLYWSSVGCDIHASEKTYELMKTEWDNIVRWTQQSYPDYPRIPLVLPMQLHIEIGKLQDGKVIMLYLGPTHTEDGIFVYFPEEQVLYGGCILKNFLGNLEFANLEEYPKTLQKLKDLELPIQTIIAGHGKAVHGPELIDHYLRLLEQNSSNQ